MFLEEGDSQQASLGESLVNIGHLDSQILNILDLFKRGEECGRFAELI